MVTKPLRDRDEGAVKWPAALDTPRLCTDRDDLCAAYFRVAHGFDLLVDHPVQTQDQLLIVVTEGDLVVEADSGPFAVREGASALVPPGSWRITEAPAAGQFGYWLVFFSPSLLVEAIGDDPQVRELASRVTPAYRGVFVQPRLLEILHAWGQLNPTTNMMQTIRAMAASMSASFYMFLKEHYYLPRQRLQDEARLWRMDNTRKVGHAWPGGAPAFRREFRFYHGLSAAEWMLSLKRLES